jgi:hypothetical protein
MKRISNLLFVCIFMLSTFSSAADLDAIYRAQRVSLMLSQVISGHYELDMSDYQKEDRDLVALLKSPAASHIKILNRDNQFIIQFDNKAAILVEITNDKIYLNEHELKLNPAISISQNLKNFALESKNRNRTKGTKSALLWRLLNSLAVASPVQDQAWEAAKNIAFGGLQVIDAYSNLAAGSATLSAAIADGAAASVSTAVAVTAASVAVALVLVAVIACGQEAVAASHQHQTKKSQELLNCFSKPLSWIGKNPRDRLYIQDISCPKKDSVVVEFESQIHQKIQLSLSFQNGRYAYSMPADPGAVAADPKLDAQYSKWFENKELQKKMEIDALYFHQVCNDPKLLAAFRKAVKQARAQGHVYTGDPAPPRTATK